MTWPWKLPGLLLGYLLVRPNSLAPAWALRRAWNCCSVPCAARGGPDDKLMTSPVSGEDSIIADVPQFPRCQHQE